MLFIAGWNNRAEISGLSEEDELDITCYNGDRTGQALRPTRATVR